MKPSRPIATKVTFNTVRVVVPNFAELVYGKYKPDGSRYR